MLQQMPLVEIGMDRQKLDRGDAELVQMLDHRGSGQAAISAAQRLGHVLAQLGQAFDMGLVDDAVFPRHVGMAVLTPGVGLVDHDRLEHELRVVAAVERQVLALVADPIGEMHVGPLEGAAESHAVGIDQEFVRIETKARLRIVRPVHAVAVELARLRVGQVAVPDILRTLRQLEAVHLVAPGFVEQTKLDLFGTGGEQCEVRALAVPGRAQRMRRAGRNAPVSLQERDRG